MWQAEIREESERKLSDSVERKRVAAEVESNSSLGKALQYLVNHWAGLTKFLSVGSAPLDNNVVERALKLVVLGRKNSLFYKTEHGAAVGDIIMSIIETCRINQVSAWEYLLALARNARLVRGDPAAWLPWSYQQEESQRQAA